MKLYQMAIFGLLFTANAYSCDSIYVNVIGKVSAVEAAVVKEVKTSLEGLYEESKVVDSHLFIFPNDSENPKVDANSVIINLNGETDMTGSDVKVSLFKSDSEGQIVFLGSHLESTNGFTKGKFKTLHDLAVKAVNFSCGRY